MFWNFFSSILKFSKSCLRLHTQLVCLNFFVINGGDRTRAAYNFEQSNIATLQYGMLRVMIKVVDCQGSGNAIVTLAVGSEYYNSWLNNSSKLWIQYCQKNQVGLFIQVDSLDTRANAKKVTWQKLLLPSELKKQFPEVVNFCYLDSDILVNPFAENVFDLINPNKVNLVSQFKNLPFDLRTAQKMVSLNRNFWYSSEYPLDSSIHMGPKDIFRHHKFREFDDYACMGFIAGSIENLSIHFNAIYEKYDSNLYSLTNGGDEPILNFEFQSELDIEWLPYKFQAIWIFEMSTKYDFLYDLNFYSRELVSRCVDSVLAQNVFLHFAGSWGESKMIECGPFIMNELYFQRLNEYLNRQVSFKLHGVLRPR